MVTGKYSQVLPNELPVSIIRDMDIKTYVDQFRNSGGSANLFAEKMGTSAMYLCHLINGRKPKPTMDTIMAAINASDGEISIRSLRQDLFPNTAEGDAALRNLIKSAQRELTPKPKKRPEKPLRNRQGKAA